VNPAQEPPHVAAFFRAIEERRKEDPMIGAVLGGKEVCQRLIEAMKDAKGVHVESLLSLLGSLAGFSCQMSIRTENPAAGDSAFVVVGGADGRNSFFGDRLNQPLAESQYSVWGLTAGKAQGLGCTELPDLNEIFSYVATTVGGDRFGIPRIPDGHRPGDLPLNYLKAFWPGIMPIVSKFCARPPEWPILFGIAIQEIMTMGKDVIDPKLATIIVMECAVPMSKIDPNW
jgi:hypothetical protein